jgi:hypothetical protein
VPVPVCQYVSDFKEVFNYDSKVLFCQACGTSTVTRQHSQVTQHLSASKHIAAVFRLKDQPGRQSIIGESYKETLECWHLIFWPKSQRRVQCHTPKLEPNQRVTIPSLVSPNVTFDLQFHTKCNFFCTEIYMVHNIVVWQIATCHPVTAIGFLVIKPWHCGLSELLLH